MADITPFPPPKVAPVPDEELVVTGVVSRGEAGLIELDIGTPTSVLLMTDQQAVSLARALLNEVVLT